MIHKRCTFPQDKETQLQFPFWDFRGKRLSFALEVKCEWKYVWDVQTSLPLWFVFWGQDTRSFSTRQGNRKFAILFQILFLPPCFSFSRLPSSPPLCILFFLLLDILPRLFSFVNSGRWSPSPPHPLFSIPCSPLFILSHFSVYASLPVFPVSSFFPFLLRQFSNPPFPFFISCFFSLLIPSYVELPFVFLSYLNFSLSLHR